jgi:simple sugar transport system ATP-binding protein
MNTIRQETSKVLERIGIRRKRSPDTITAVLSGGERQAINIGRAMYFEAKLIILDEPTTALSVKETEIVLNFIENVKQQGIPVIFITHNIYHVYQVADRFVILDRGVKVADLAKEGVTPEEIMNIVREGKALDEEMTGVK